MLASNGSSIKQNNVIWINKMLNSQLTNGALWTVSEDVRFLSGIRRKYTKEGIMLAVNLHNAPYSDAVWLDLPVES